MGVMGSESRVIGEMVVVEGTKIMDVVEVEDHVGAMIDGNREVMTEAVSVEAMSTVGLATRRGKDVSTGAEGHTLPRYVKIHR